MLGLQRDGVETKDIIPWGRGALSTEDGNNFTTNRMTVADVKDISHAAGKGAMGLSATWACVNLLAGTISSLPLMVYRDRGNGIKEVAKDHPLYWLLHDSPNYDQTAVDFLEYMAASIELHGNAYAEINRREGDGLITSLVPIKPDPVRARRNRNGEIEYSWTVDGKQINRLGRNILHIRGPLGDALSGSSALSVCRPTFNSALSAHSAAETLFSNGIRSTGIFSTDPSVALNADQRREFDEFLRERYMGARNQGRPLLLDRGMKFQSLDISPDDAQMLESRNFSIEEICRVFGVPPHLVGHTSGNTSLGSSIEEQTLAFVKFNLRRRLKRMEQALEKQLLPKVERDAGISIEFNLEGLLRGDTKSRSAFYESGLKNKWRTINEVRALENLPPVPWGDRPWGQQQDIQLQEDGTVPPAVVPSSQDDGEV